MSLLPDIEDGQIVEEPAKVYTPPVGKYAPRWVDDGHKWNNDGHKKVSRDFSDYNLEK